MQVRNEVRYKFARSRAVNENTFMEMKELKTKSQSELNKLLGDFRDKLRDLRFRDASKQLKNVRDIRTLRQDIARIMTVLNSNK